MFSTIAALLKLLPELIAIAKQLKSHQREKFYKDLNDAINGVRTAITDDERAKAVKNISDLFSRLG